VDHDHDPTSYGRRAAADYDLVYGDTFDTEGAVECLARLADEGPVLEWGIGTGRLALGLVDRGLSVSGLDSSQDMLDVLSEKPGGDRIHTIVGDFSETRVDGAFALVVLAINTLFALPDQESQVRCFRNAAAHLQPGGRFVVEAWVPDVASFTRNERVSQRHIGGDEVAIVLARLAPADQVIEVTQLQISERGCRLFPLRHRYAWPAELDLMAQLAGLELEHRWRNWRGAAFDDTSLEHVSVYRSPSAP
jgi:SAM-dependent methyltransferase